jgi:hypothetical protein
MACFCAAGQATGGCDFGYPDCETQQEEIGKHDPQPDGLTAAEFMDGLDGERAIELQWSGRNDELGIAFELPAYAETGSLALAPDWSTALQLEAGAKPCGRRSIVVEFEATVRTDDGALDHTFELLAQQLGDERELRSGWAPADALSGTLELHNPTPPQAHVTSWLLELGCTGETCEGQLVAIVGGVSEPRPGGAPRVTIAAWVTRG